MDSVPDRPASLSSSLGAYAAKNAQRAAIFCGDVAMSYEALEHYFK